MKYGKYEFHWSILNIDLVFVSLWKDDKHKISFVDIK